LTPAELKRVLVEGAGTPGVDGICCRVHEEMNLSAEEVLFVKDMDVGAGEAGLRLCNAWWHLAPCLDPPQPQS
jgi:hypothetical protein